jgi:maleate isomerase
MTAERRTRLGIILPSVNTVVEAWLPRLLPDTVSVHTARMLLTSDVSAESLVKMDHDEGVAAARQLATCRPDVIAYGCTASSLVQGVEYDRSLKPLLEDTTGTRCFTAASAIIEALHAVSAKSICIASPYTDAIDHAEKHFFEEAGFEVVATANLNIADGFALANPTPDEMRQLCRAAWRPAADALLISCLNMNSQDVAGELEVELGKPVVTSTTAMLWKLLKVAGVRHSIPGCGRLLAS